MTARPAGRLVGLLAVLLLAACAAPAPEPVYSPPNYGYLKKLRLNVGAVDIVDDWAPGPEDIGAVSPVRPLDALERMARERLVAAGGRAGAVFHIEDAAIRRIGDTLNGDLVVRLDIRRANGTRAGYAEARVTRTAILPDSAWLRRTLYTMTTQMMADMNVELEYQLRRTLGRWLESAAPPGSALPVPVQRQPLPPPEPPATGF